MTADEIITVFGGTKSVSELTGASRHAVANWTRYGIPARYWPVLARRKKPGINLAALEMHQFPLKKPSLKRSDSRVDADSLPQEPR